MLISALCDYYDILASKNEVLPKGYSEVGISYLISLSEDGKLVDLIDCRVKDPISPKSKLQPQRMLFPERIETTKIASNFIEHRPAYIFGLNYVKDPKDKSVYILTADDPKDKARKSHEDFRKRNLTEIAGIDEPLVNAYRRFIENWVPEHETENPKLLELGKEISGAAYFAFCLDGRPDVLLHSVKEVKEYWEKSTEQTTGTAELSTCAITGEAGEIARLHNKIKGVLGGQASGTALVSYNSAAEESYGAVQSMNSNITEGTMRKYTEALNYLLSHRKHKTTIDDITVVHWAASENDVYDELFEDCLSGFGDNEGTDAQEMEDALDRLVKNAKEGISGIDMRELLRGLDPGVTFYTVGIKPNAARLSLKFIYRNSFASILMNIAQHISDMKITPDSKPVPLWRLKKQLVSPKSSDEKLDPSLTTKLFEAMINGTMYPGWLLSTLVRRIRTDSDIDNNSNQIRMGMLKACINRSTRLNGKKEVIQLALDRTNTDPAYLCGRLFAVLEAIQQRASNYSLNRTIKDAYFASASVRPAVIFPKLISLSQHHMAKLDNSYYAEKEITEIIACMGDQFPALLSLQEQGIFMLGYYQQKSDTEQRIKQYKEEK